MEKMLRPKAVVLSDQSLIPDQNLISPAPNQFTHELKRAEPFYFSDAERATEPNGELAAGAMVVLLVYDNAKYCRVVTEQGLYVEVEHSSLERL